MVKMKIIAGFLILTLSSVVFAFVGDPGYTDIPKPFYSPGIYIGVQGGMGYSGWKSIDTNNTPYRVKDSNGFTGRAFLGYDISRNFGLEAGFTYFFMRANITIPGGDQPDPLGLQPGNFSSQIYIADLVAKLKVELFRNFDIYGKLGGDIEFVDKNLNQSFQRDYAPVIGGGVSYNVTPNFTVDLSWTRFGGRQVWDQKYLPYADFIAAGISYKFVL